MLCFRSTESGFRSRVSRSIWRSFRKDAKCNNTESGTRNTGIMARGNELTGKDSVPGSSAKQRQSAPRVAQITVGNLIQAGFIRPPLRIERTYKDVHLTAKDVHLTAVVRQDGKVEFDGQAYDSLSTAAGIARKSIIGSAAGQSFPQTNGWTFWRYTDDGVLREVDHLRRSYLAQRKLKVVPMS